MKIVFLGVGEACDERLPNTSIWVQSQLGKERVSVMLDCGFTAPSEYWRRGGDKDELDALWISHFHGDHFFGIPALLLRFWETGRHKPFTIVSQPGIEELVSQTMNLAYPSILGKLQYPLRFVTAEPGRSFSVAGLTWRAAENGHGQKDLAVRIEDGRKAIFYSGDGRPTEATLELALGCRLIIHEAFRLEQITPGHGNVRECISFATEAGASMLALVHLQRDERFELHSRILEVMEQASELHVVLPEPGDVVDL